MGQVSGGECHAASGAGAQVPPSRVGWLLQCEPLSPGLSFPSCPGQAELPALGAPCQHPPAPQALGSPCCGPAPPSTRPGCLPRDVLAWRRIVILGSLQHPALGRESSALVSKTPTLAGSCGWQMEADKLNKLGHCHFLADIPSYSLHTVRKTRQALGWGGSGLSRIHGWFWDARPCPNPPGAAQLVLWGAFACRASGDLCVTSDEEAGGKARVPVPRLTWEPRTQTWPHPGSCEAALTPGNLALGQAGASLVS